MLLDSVYQICAQIVLKKNEPRWLESTLCKNMTLDLKYSYQVTQRRQTDKQTSLQYTSPSRSSGAGNYVI